MCVCMCVSMRLEMHRLNVGHYTSHSRECNFRLHLIGISIVMKTGRERERMRNIVRFMSLVVHCYDETYMPSFWLETSELWILSRVGETENSDSYQRKRGVDVVVSLTRCCFFVCCNVTSWVQTDVDSLSRTCSSSIRFFLLNHIVNSFIHQNDTSACKRRKDVCFFFLHWTAYNFFVFLLLFTFPT